MLEVKKLRSALHEESHERGELEAKLISLGQDLLRVRREQQDLHYRDFNESPGGIDGDGVLPSSNPDEPFNNKAESYGRGLSSDLSNRLNVEITTLMNRVDELETALKNSQVAKSKEAKRSSSLGNAHCSSIIKGGLCISS